MFPKTLCSKGFQQMIMYFSAPGRVKLPDTMTGANLSNCQRLSEFTFHFSCGIPEFFSEIKKQPIKVDDQAF